jgi:hypothetical protein
MKKFYIKQHSLCYVHKYTSPSWKSNKESVHTNDQPHGFHQPAKGISWNVPGQNKISYEQSSIRDLIKSSSEITASYQNNDSQKCHANQNGKYIRKIRIMNRTYTGTWV